MLKTFKVIFYVRMPHFCRTILTGILHLSKKSWTTFTSCNSLAPIRSDIPTCLIILLMVHALRSRNKSTCLMSKIIYNTILPDCYSFDTIPVAPVNNITVVNNQSVSQFFYGTAFVLFNIGHGCWVFAPNRSSRLPHREWRGGMQNSPL